MDNPEKPVTSGTQDEGKQNKKHNTKNQNRQATRTLPKTISSCLLQDTRHVIHS